jgi:hypothetical protein
LRPAAWVLARLLVACAIVGTVLGFGSDPTIWRHH